MARRWATLCRAGPLPHRQASQRAASKSRHVVRRSGHGARKFRLVGFLRYSHAPGVLPLASGQRMQAQRAARNHAQGAQAAAPAASSARSRPLATPGSTKASAPPSRPAAPTRRRSARSAVARSALLPPWPAAASPSAACRREGIYFYGELRRMS